MRWSGADRSWTRSGARSDASKKVPLRLAYSPDSLKDTLQKRSNSSHRALQASWPNYYISALQVHDHVEPCIARFCICNYTARSVDFVNRKSDSPHAFRQHDNLVPTPIQVYRIKRFLSKNTLRCYLVPPYLSRAHTTSVSPYPLAEGIPAIGPILHGARIAKGALSDSAKAVTRGPARSVARRLD